MLTREQFDVLVEIERGLEETACKFLRMNKKQYDMVCHELENNGFMVGNSLTERGYIELEPYRVKRALFLAAGLGSRMEPLTYSLPKPLINVNGKRIIETLLEAVVEAGITEIYIIRGYMKEAFDMLLKDYPMVKFMDNPFYDVANNISSAYMIKEMMENSYVLESDLVLYNKRIIRKYEYETNYLGRETPYTEDWCFKMENGYVKDLLIGGTKVSHMYGISYWSSPDGKKMKEDIKKVYSGPEGKNKYWDEVSMRDCKENYRIRVRPVYEGDIIEIDTYEELELIDKRYRK